MRPTTPHAPESARKKYAVRLDDETQEKLKDVAKNQGIAPATLARMLIEDGLSKRFVIEQGNMRIALDRVETKIERIDTMMEGAFQLAAKNSEILLRLFAMQTMVEVSNKMNLNKEFAQPDWEQKRKERIARLFRLTEDMIDILNLRET